MKRVNWSEQVSSSGLVSALLYSYYLIFFTIILLSHGPQLLLAQKSIATTSSGFLTFASTPPSNTIASTNYTEDGFTDGFQVIMDTTYDDGTILLRIRSNTDKTCEPEKLYLRIITTDGTLLKININSSQFSSDNFCPETGFGTSPYFYGGAESFGYYADNIKIFAIARNYILLNYICGNSSQNRFCWMVVDWSGNVLQRDVPIGGNCDALGIAQNINSQSGFLWVCYMNSTSQLIWTKASHPDITGNISIINSGTISNIQKFNSNFTSIFPTEDGGYGIVTAQYTSVDNSSGVAEYYPPWTAFVNFIPPGTGNETKGPFQIFQQTNQVLISLNIFRCTISFASYGYNCIMYQVPLNGGSSFLNLEFLRSGAVVGTNPINVNVTRSVVWDTKTLFEGGYLIMTDVNNAVDGNVYANNGSFYGDWGMSTTYNYTRHAGVFPNNTVWAIALGSDNRTWTYVSSYALSNYRDAPDPGGYDNAFILSTTPQKAATISGRTTTKLTINFAKIVDLTNGGNISIWQLNSSSPLSYSTSTTISSLYLPNSLNSVDILLRLLSNSSSSSNSSTLSSYLTYATSSSISSILRQTFSGVNSQFVRLINGNTTVELDVLESTFNQEGVVYFVIIDNGFVEDSAVVQPLLGLRPLAWNFTTDYSDPDTNSGSLNAIIRLTPEGTSYYTSLSAQNKTMFVDQLSKEISSTVPCSFTRLSVSRHYQFDPNVAVPQILMRVSVNAVSSTNTNSASTILAGIRRERSSSRVVQDLNTLILNRDVTPISQKPITSFLDSKFGCQTTPSLWTRYRWILFGVSFGLLILFIVFLITQKRYKEGRNFIVFTFTLTAVDFVMDILFIISNGHDLKWLFDVSISFLMIPIGINFLFTFLTITHEIAENNGFSRWWFRNPRVALALTLLSGVDMESLNVVLLECERVHVRFSDRGLRYIIMFNLFSICIEDLPQLVILILYQVYTVIPAIIPILTLSSCSIVLPLKIISVIYSLILHHNRSSGPSKLPDKPSDEHRSRDSSDGDDVDTPGHPVIRPLSIRIPAGEGLTPEVKTVTSTKLVGDSITRVEVPPMSAKGDVGERIFPEVEKTTSSMSETGDIMGGSSMTPTSEPYKSKMIEQIDVPEEQWTPPPKKSLSLRLGLFGSKSKKDSSGGGKGKSRVSMPKLPKGDTSDDDGGGRSGDEDENDGEGKNIERDDE